MALQLRDEMVAERSQETPVALRGDRADRSHDAPPGENDEEPGADDGCSEQAARREIGIGGKDQLVELRNAKVKPSADAADEQVMVEGHFPQNESGPSLPLIICLRNFCDDDITLPHSPDSAP